MSHIHDLAFNLNMTVGVPGIAESKIADKFDEYANNLYDYCKAHLEEILSLKIDEGYHVGMAFSHIVDKTPESVSEDPFKDDDTRLKLSLYCAVICLWRAIQQGTMQSVIATHTLIRLIDKYRLRYFEPIFMMLTGLSLRQIIEEKTPDEVKKMTEKIYKIIKYYLLQITRMQDAFKDANLKACELGEKFMNTIHNEMCGSLRGYITLGLL